MSIFRAQQSKLYTQPRLGQEWIALDREHKFNLPSEPGRAQGGNTGD